MKKTIIALVLLVASTAMVSAQDMTKKEIRQQERSAKEAAFVAQVNTAISNQSFTFTATEMMPMFGNPVSLGFVSQNIMSVTKNYIDVELPYQPLANLSQNPIRMINFTSQAYQYTSVFENGSWNVVINVKAINAQRAEVGLSEQYTLHLTFNVKSRVASLTVIPKNNTPVTYTGNLSFTN